MKACEVHDQCIVVYNGIDCPLRKGQKTIKTVWEELAKWVTILKELKKSGEEAGFRFN